ncbi:hypothetical protein scyTo_0013801 [Scyliorhinus torazame]|uniref:Peptidase A2 domain-containing protein n=1 Tax=Scyliorhinus torazame TaxID=75743 RepID=A0A401P552_SCYTO|nr:hypothetical protein [Scyliorhinus torazame]
MRNNASTLQNASRRRQDEDISATGGAEDSFFIDIVMEDPERFYKIEETGTGQVDNWTIQLTINQTSTYIKMDTGARANFISEADAKKICIQPHTQPDNECSLTDYHGAHIKTLGKCTLHVEVNNQSYLVEFALVEVDKDYC